jgi:hypothetical protein
MRHGAREVPVRAALLLSSVACASSGPSPPSGPAPALVVALSDFAQGPDGRPALQPARALVLRASGGRLWPSEIRDPASNAFHKAVPWRGGLLTIGANRARVAWWPAGEPSAPTVLWDVQFGGAHDRVRDLEIGDVRGDGRASLVVATHDQGIVAIGDDGPEGWTWTELGRRPRTFVHEIELGDLDGDGALEIYATPSEPNRASGGSQPGGVERWLADGSGFRREPIAAWPDTHAKEILVADVGSGPELFAVKEGRIGPGGALLAPVEIVRLRPAVGGWEESRVAVLPGERQSRFLVAGDLDGLGRTSLVATGMTTGVWRIDLGPDGGRATRFDSASGGYEQAAHFADLDGDGRDELYVVSERAGEPREIRRYSAVRGERVRDVVFVLPGDGIAWGLSDGTL